MSWLVRSRRLLPHVGRRAGGGRPFCFPAATASAGPSSKEPIVAAAGAALGDQAASATSAASSSSASSAGADGAAKGSRAGSAVKLGVIAALMGAVGATSYVTYGLPLRSLLQLAHVFVFSAISFALVTLRD